MRVPPAADAALHNQRPEYEPPFVICLGSVHDLTYGSFPPWAESLAAAAATATVLPYVQSIAIELGKRTVKAAPKIFRGVSIRWRFTRKNGKKTVKSAEIQVEFNTATTVILLTNELPDEARLILLDLDLASDDTKGKTLIWDTESGTWKSVRLGWRNRMLMRRHMNRTGKLPLVFPCLADPLMPSEYEFNLTREIKFLEFFAV